MDNQFRNVKAHARLLSKSMWYEWRMKLLEGLKQGLDSHVQDMIRDARVLSKKEELLGDMVPELIEMHARLQVEAHNLKKMVEEMESCDQEELRRAREKIAMVEQEIAQRKTAWAEAQANMEENSSVIEVGAERKALLLKEIEEAESVLEECRGWSVKEVGGLRGKNPIS